MKSYKYAGCYIDFNSGQWEAKHNKQVITTGKSLHQVMAELKRMQLANEGPWKNRRFL